MPYVYLLLAIFAEVVGTSQIQATRGLSRLWPTVGGTVAYCIAFGLLALAIHRGMPVSVGYALWSGLGTAAIVTIGVLFLGETLSLSKIVGIALVVGGVVLLNVAGAH